jgi:predicted lipoprotein
MDALSVVKASLRRLVPALVFGAIGICAANANDKATAIVNASVDGFIRPAYGALAERTAALSDDIGTLCVTPSAENLGEARRDFQGASDAWSYAEIIRFGPVTEDNRLERLLFWPDRKGIGLKQVQETIAEKDADAADPAKLAAKSVAMQGFGALEFVLFGTDSDGLATGGDPYRCKYGAAIAANIAGMTADIAAAWQKPDGFVAKWANPEPDNPRYQTGSEAVTELLSVFVDELEMMRDVRISGFLAGVAKFDKPKQAIYWRSDGTVRSLAANLAGMKALFDASGLDSYLTTDMHWIAESIDFEFGNGIAAANAADGPTAEALANPEKRSKLVYLQIVTSSLSELFAKRLAEQFGLTSGFSSLDGD